jgi:Putative restriction endonuclease
MVTLAEFDAFRDPSPEHEKWELIAGIPTLAARATIVHQRVAGNIASRINRQLLQSKPETTAAFSVGVRTPGNDTFSAVPDVAVIDTAVELGQIYSLRFYMIAEVLAARGARAVLDSKLGSYKSHPDCSAILLVHERRIAAELHLRTDSWQPKHLSNRASSIGIPGIGDIGPLGEIYVDTPLFTS